MASEYLEAALFLLACIALAFYLADLGEEWDERK